MQFTQVTLVVLGLVGSTAGTESHSQEEKSVIRSAFNRAFALTNPSLTGVKRFAADDELNVEEEPIITTVASEEEAYHFADYGNVAYCGNTHLQDWDCKQCKEQVKLVHVANEPRYKGRAIIARDTVRKEIVLLFRGSHNIRNWLQNFVYEYSELKYAPGARVHKGFGDSSVALISHYSKALAFEMNEHPDHRLVIVGHSLGGAQAIISALELNYRMQIPFEKMSVFTYGQPRTGNVQFARYVNSRPMQVTRVVNESDMVPHSIPEYGGFIHHGTEMHIRNNKSIICSTKTLEDPTCSRSAFPKLSPSSHFLAWDKEVGSFSCMTMKLPLKMRS
ncbi:hypothetical protein DSO57_1015732 [Entomophthora muscae]|uniref:Uncharacterized protein n=1 Tax=Entomophthora muscae TaxID=34485 RepID=A0ACC2TSP1_9FUNG|nr:hypothetical protein DSO57_1015732 [Entomophthora muscae]